MSAQTVEGGKPPWSPRYTQLFHSCVPTSEFGSSWPADVPVQVHAMEADPFFVDEADLDAARTLVE